MDRALTLLRHAKGIRTIDGKATTKVMKFRQTKKAVQLIVASVEQPF